jgi:hypothetical protein
MPSSGPKVKYQFFLAKNLADKVTIFLKYLFQDRRNLRFIKFALEV